MHRVQMLAAAMKTRPSQSSQLDWPWSGALPAQPGGGLSWVRRRPWPLMHCIRGMQAALALHASMSGP